MSLFKGIVYLTQAQYDALSVKDPDTLYIVHDKTIPVPTTTDNGKVVGIVNGNYRFIDITYDDATTTTHGLMTAADKVKLNALNKGQANGVAELGSDGKVPEAQLPSYVDDVIEGYYYNNKFYKDSSHTQEINPEKSKIYVDLATNKTYRWSGSAYVEISASLALGETSSTAYRGDKGKTAYDHATAKGSAFSSELYKITTNSEGHVTAATAVVKSDITALGIPAQDTTYNDVTTSAHGLMTAGDKTKLNGIAIGAEVNQNAFSNIVVGSTTIAADSKTDTVTVVAGSNITLTPDATNDKLTIAATDTTYTSKSAVSGGTDVSLVTTGEKYTWNNKQDVITDLSTIRSNAALGATAYQKPSTGIPKTDLASAVQTSLNKVDDLIIVSSSQPTSSNCKIWIEI